MNNIYRIIILLLAISVTACATEGQSLNVAADEDKDIGLGGTGLLADMSGGLGGTGIVGEITGFGSIFVNGVEIEYHQGTPFTINGETATMQSLQIGDVVEVLTTDASKHTQAQQINLRHEVIGKVTAVDSKTSSFTVSGQTIINSARKNILPSVGNTVAVSGFRINESSIQATRVTVTEAGKSLLRKHIVLPFQQLADRWLVQAYVQNQQVSVDLDGNTHVIPVADKAGNSLPGDSATRIMQLKKSASGELVFDRVFEPMGMPQGRQTLTPGQQPGGMMGPGSAPVSTPGAKQRSTPGSMRMNMVPELYRRG